MTEMFKCLEPKHETQYACFMKDNQVASHPIIGFQATEDIRNETDSHKSNIKHAALSLPWPRKLCPGILSVLCLLKDDCLRISI